MRWYIIDSFNFIDPQEGKAQAKRAITRADGFFEEHYHLYPVLPEVIQIEMMAQAGGILAGSILDFKKEIILGKIDWARFYQPVYPPSNLLIDTWVTEKTDGGTRIEGKVSCEGAVVSESSILLVHIDKLETMDLAKNGDPIVFNADFMNSFHIKEMLGASVR